MFEFKVSFKFKVRLFVCMSQKGTELKKVPTSQAQQDRSKSEDTAQFYNLIWLKNWLLSILTVALPELNSK